MSSEEKKAEEQKPEEKKPEEKKVTEKKAEAKPAAEAKAKEAAKPKEEAKPGEVIKKRKLVKGRHHSAIKRHRQSVKRAARNEAAISYLKTAMKKVRQAVLSKNGKAAGETLKEAVSSLHKAASRGIIHPRNASRHIARLSSLVNSSA